VLKRCEKRASDSKSGTAKIGDYESDGNGYDDVHTEKQATLSGLIRGVQLARNAARNPFFPAINHAFCAQYANGLKAPKVFGDTGFRFKRGERVTLAPSQTRYQTALRPDGSQYIAAMSAG
jgi:hypothetical protein